MWEKGLVYEWGDLAKKKKKTAKVRSRKIGD